MKFRHRVAATLPAILAISILAQPVRAGEKIESITDLPVRTYPTDQAPSEMLQDEALMDALRTQVKSDVESILDRYDIDDTATLKRFYGVLSSIALFEGRNGDARDYWEKVRGLEDKESAKLMVGLNGASLIAAREAGDPGTDAYNEAYATSYTELLGAMPWDVVQDAIQGKKGREEIVTGNLVLGMVETNMDPVVAENGELSDEMAESLLGVQLMLRDFMPLREYRIAALQARIDANHEEKQDIWPARSVTLSADAGYTPVVVGVWDSGVDAEVFGDQMWTNEGEVYNGLDDDDNGFVDDIHGIAYDMFGARHPNLLHPHGDMTGRVESSMRYMKGLSDLQSAIDSPEASELKQYIGGLATSEVSGFLTTLGFTSLYMHGTHVAGIAIDGNPYARVLCARISFDYHPQPAPILLQSAQAYARAYAETVGYFQEAGVRVVNMSWGWSFSEIEGSLEANGIGESAEERKAMTEEIFGTLDEGLHAAMASAPEIIFMIAAGNADNDVAFDRNIPSAYELDNIMVVGAVDQAGERTSFTSMGENVVVYANGFEVESYVPGGGRMAASGTSMASPNALNLAAKLIAVDPELPARDVISLIERGADQLSDQEGLKLLNPAASMALLEASQASK